ncbi:cyclopropane-fatty-acyl-phospholipid synthase [Leptospira wolbachii serovar Codice str. CDC]|uniref:Cyclopropane-fatty-acyl-phospholipid synthase n=1 Tax=Leptospira wolbachii serovar Codice str. CDC TaxID=1218599 RepID=R9A447_9LEPT|nr:cyclopropane-fatty-acyl-phospholipid synthase family protein [Leptospira wolbachii]EOQ95020.1 cyclopropane-fatty-acyl-phospholipid synthase [Leptospira wolbachii serovar Codice str. CDC]
MNFNDSPSKKEGSAFNINSLLEKDIFPDWLIRFRIRQLLNLRIKQERKESVTAQLQHKMNYVNELKKSPIAVHTEAANEQHYEVPSDFFTYVMGPRMKYSSGYWPSLDTSFAESEEEMLRITVERAEIKNGMKVLDLGCGWGSISLYIAEHFPKSKVTGVSNSKTQKEFIDKRAKERGLKNLTIITKDMNDFTTKDKFDRIVSVEMLEHMKNYEKLFEKLSKFLVADGKFFIHIFTHKEFAYPFEVIDETDFMAKYFFTGGQMPSDDLFLYFQKDFLIENHWVVNGTHYARTSEAWYDNMILNKDKLLPILASTYGEKEKTKWFVYWKVFFLACAELWDYRNGEEWFVSHYLLRKR